MDALITDIELAFAEFSWTNALEVTAIAVVLYAGLRLLRGTTAISVIRGMVLVVIAISVMGRLVDSVVLDWIVDNALAVLLIVVLLVFQPEFRRAFEHVGRAGGLRRFGGWSGRQRYAPLIPMAATVAQRLAKQGVGGLFIFVRDTGLEELADSGVRLNAEPTAELLQSIFWPGSPLHDGAVLLRPNEVLAAGVILPTNGPGFTAPTELEEQHGGHLGTRHRAALTVSVDSDAVALVISEETGDITLAAGGVLSAPLEGEALEAALALQLHPPGWSDRMARQLGGGRGQAGQGRRAAGA